MDKTITQEKTIEKIVHRQVAGALREILGDPDFGFELSKEVNSRLQKSIRSANKGRVRNLQDILAEYSA